jgi:hypothetical protein
VCKWLYHHGAAEDISRANNNGDTPMLLACFNGHLSVCEWLYKMGADEDVSRVDNYGNTPMLLACWNGHLPVCEWLVFNGALNRPTSSSAAAAAAAQEEEGDNDPSIVERDTREGRHHRLALLTWANGVVATHKTFLHVVLRASVIMPDAHQQASPDGRCLLPLLSRDELERVGSFVGVETGRRLRNVRGFAEALEEL